MIEYLLIGGAALALILASSSDDKKTSTPAGGGGDADKDKCPYGSDKPVDKLPPELKNAVIAALTVETDPKELEDFAVQLDKLCQPTAAKALRTKKKALEGQIATAGLPPGTDLGTVPGLPDIIGKSPVPAPGMPTTPDGMPILLPDGSPATNTPPPSDSFERLTAEPIGYVFWKPRENCQSPPTTQWWTGPFDGNCTVTDTSKCSLFYLAEAITGNGLRYVELIQANPELFAIGDPLNPMLTGYSFVGGIKDGERLRVPKSWDQYIDETGDYSGGTVYSYCPPEVTLPTPPIGPVSPAIDPFDPTI